MTTGLPDTDRDEDRRLRPNVGEGDLSYSANAALSMTPGALGACDTEGRRSEAAAQTRPPWGRSTRAWGPTPR